MSEVTPYRGQPSPQHIFRAAILNGVQPPADTVAQLESCGINTADLEQRIRQSIGLRD